MAYWCACWRLTATFYRRAFRCRSSAARAAAEHIRTAAEVEAVRQREQVAQIYTANPALLRLRELDALSNLAKVATARIYIGFDKTRPPRSRRWQRRGMIGHD